MKRKINKEAWEKLSPELQALYKADGDNYVLDLEDDEDVGALLRAKEHEKTARQAAEKEAKELKDKLDKLGYETSKNNKDIDAIEKSWADKLEAQKKEFEDKILSANSKMKNLLVDNVASDLANKLSTAPKLLLPHIKNRLSVDFDGEMPKTRILDNEGKPSALTIEDFEKEILANKEYSAILKGNSSSGSGASQDGRNLTSRLGSANGEDGKPVDLASLPPKELVARLKQSKQQTTME